MNENKRFDHVIEALIEGMRHAIRPHQPDTALEPWIFRADGKPICCLWDWGMSLDEAMRHAERSNGAEYVAWRRVA